MFLDNIKRLLKVSVFFVGWMLSPLTWWNDAFINIPLSYLIANIIFYITGISFGRLVIISYWFTNVLGLIMVWFSGKDIILSSKKRLRISSLLLIALMGYTVLIIYIERSGRLLPIGAFLNRLIK